MSADDVGFARITDAQADLLEGRVTSNAANDVLWHFGEPAVATEPGSFRKALIRAIAAADPVNQVRLALGFPDAVAAVQLAQGRSDGMDRLRRRLARSHRE